MLLDRVPSQTDSDELFDEWDNLLDRKYNLPKPSPRKNIKRLENLITMCCQNAVAHVFFYKQVRLTDRPSLWPTDHANRC